ncbi:MAG: DUF933 domain-containing protein [Planctomycetota bacterium]|nr:DUF933 domain-containing protein [Planctomycetota bacterium]
MKLPAIGLVGLPCAGKTSLFRAIVGRGHGHEAERPDQASVAIVNIPDARLDAIVKSLAVSRRVYATVEVNDFPPILGGARVKGKGGSGELLNQLRQQDMLIGVLPAYERGGSAADAELRKLQGEMLLADQQVIESAIDRLDKDSRRRGLTADEREKIDHLETVRRAIESGDSIGADKLPSFERLAAFSVPLLCTKPQILVSNVAEASAPSRPIPGLFGASVDPVCVPCKTELELQELPEEERRAFREEMKIPVPPWDLLAPKILEALKVLTFYTAVGEEARAWHLHRGGTALDAAAQVHTDIAHGFVKAEVVAFDDLAGHGSLKNVKQAGKLALEGKDYVVKDGDIIAIRFSK